jgi:hypothetical protein
MIVYDDVSDLKNKKTVINITTDFSISEFWYEWNWYVWFYSEKIQWRWVMNTEWKIIIEPKKYSGVTDFHWEYAVFYDNKIGDWKYWVMSLPDWKILIKPNFSAISIYEGRFFWQIESSRKNTYLLKRKEIDINWNPLWQEYEKLIDCLNANNLKYPYKKICYWWDDFLWVYNEWDEKMINILEIPNSELQKWSMLNTWSLCEPDFYELDNWLILLYFEENQLIIWLNNEWKRLFETWAESFCKDFWINDQLRYSVKYTNWKILLLNEWFNQMTVLTISDFIKKLSDLWKWFHKIDDKIFFLEDNKKVNEINKITKLSELTNLDNKWLILCENIWSDNIKIKWKVYKRKLLKLK